MLLKTSSGERCVPRNLALPLTLGGTHVRLVVQHMKKIMER